jgi:YD repeat-containing protein
MKTPGGTITYAYLTGQGLLIRALPNKVQTIWEFEPNGQLRQITHVNAKRVILAEYTYEYRPDGLIAAIGERSSRGAFTTRYAYDKVGRLIRVTDLQGNEYIYEYGQLGNRLQATLPDTSPQVYAYDWAGRLISVNQKPNMHDAAGNLSSITLGETQLTYRYNSDGRLLEAGNNVVYGYDGGGRLIERRVGPETTTFMPNPFSAYWQPLVIESKRDGQALMVWDNDTPLMIIRDGNPEYLLHDHLGSTRLAVDGQGKVSATSIMIPLA